MTKDKIFRNLVDNAFRFLFKAHEEFNTEPQFSVINFYTAVELFLKARLMHEHWTLVLAPERNDKCSNSWDKFAQGDFQSVTFDQATGRLKNLVQCELTSGQKDSFNSVRLDRNKMVHFFHQETESHQQDSDMMNILKTQLRAWYSLNQLLGGSWSDVFKDWRNEINQLQLSLKDVREYLRVVFVAQENVVKEKKDQGIQFIKCGTCHFKAAELAGDPKIPNTSKCLVCDTVAVFLEIGCPECNGKINLFNEGFEKCKKCTRTIEPDDIVKILYHGSMHDDHQEHLAHCSYCDGFHSVVFLRNGCWFCASCFEFFDEVEQCDYCSEMNTGDMANTYVSGCNHCDGKGAYW